MVLSPARESQDEDILNRFPQFKTNNQAIRITTSWMECGINVALRKSYLLMLRTCSKDYPKTGAVQKVSGQPFTFLKWHDSMGA